MSEPPKTSQKKAKESKTEEEANYDTFNTTSGLRLKRLRESLDNDFKILAENVKHSGDELNQVQQNLGHPLQNGRQNSGIQNSGQTVLNAAQYAGQNGEQSDHQSDYQTGPQGLNQSPDQIHGQSAYENAYESLAQSHGQNHNQNAGSNQNGAQNNSQNAGHNPRENAYSNASQNQTAGQNGAQTAGQSPVSSLSHLVEKPKMPAPTPLSALFAATNPNKSPISASSAYTNADENPTEIIAIGKNSSKASNTPSQPQKDQLKSQLKDKPKNQVETTESNEISKLNTTGKVRNRLLKNRKGRTKVPSWDEVMFPKDDGN